MVMQKKSLGETLIEKGIITEDQLKSAREVQKSAPGDLGNIILDLGFASEKDVAAARAAVLGLQFVDLKRIPIDPEALKAVPEHIVRRYNILPIKRDSNKLMVAFSDVKASMAGLDDIRLVSRCQITPVLASRTDVEDGIRRAYGNTSTPPSHNGNGNGANGTSSPSSSSSNGTTKPGMSGVPAIPGKSEPARTSGTNSLPNVPALIKDEPAQPPAILPNKETSAVPTNSALSQVIGADIGQIGGAVDEDDGGDDMEKMAEEAPIIRIAHAIVQQAIREKTSDIHIEPGAKGVRIRYRIDGVLNEMMTVPKHIQNQLIARFKIMAEMNIAERRVPQDGRIPVKVEGKDYDLRVSCLPTFFGEKLVMRVLDKTSVLLGLNKLGFAPEVESKLGELIVQPNGMVLTTGPTGSGKTTTLYSILNQINSPDKNIITMEDPVEYQLPGVSQVQTNKKAGLTFAAGLRSFLRQDPDVIMVGEIRDLETAQIAVEAALTGHMVLSTLHTNDAPSAVMRLADMGIETYLIAATVMGIIAQRLCRKICSNCKEPYKVPAIELAKFGFVSDDPNQMVTLYRGAGCEECRHKGYKGRLGLYEMLVMTEEVRELVVRRASTADIREVAKANGMKELREDGLTKVLEGLTTPDEVRRVVFTAGF